MGGGALERDERVVAAVLALAGVLIAGCSLERVAIAGARDAGVIAADAAPRDDAGDRCVERCDGALAMRCERTTEDCAAHGERCVMIGALATCAARVCEPLRARCEGRTLLTCDAEGEHEQATTCANGCHDGACAPPPTCSRDAELTEIVQEGTYSVNVCGLADDHATRAERCEGATGNGEDTLVRLVITQRARLRLDLRDVDGPGAVDTVLSIRRDCDDVETELACANDVSCDDAEQDLRDTPCESGRQPRQSRLDVELEPGTYYVVLDTQNHGSYRCGAIELRVRPI